MSIRRRDFLKSNLAAGVAGLALGHPFLLNRQLMAAGESGNNKRLIFFFQRGGNDGINTVIPRGDSEYNRRNRPTLYIPQGNAIDTGNGFAQLHPRLEPMMEVFNKRSLNGRDGPGNLAVLHRIGYADQSRSHFDSQEYWEHGVPGNSEVKEGMFFRHLVNTMDLRDPRNDFVAASVASSQLLGLRGPSPFPNFQAANRFRFPGNEELARKILGENSTDAATAPKGILGLYEDAPEKGRRNLYTDLVQNTGQALGSTLKKVQDAAARAYEPANGADYPGGDFGDKLQEAAMLIKRTDVKILGLNIGGWDTHAEQGSAFGNHGNLLANVAQGFQALHRDLQEQWKDLIVVTMTEFGRTSKENGGGGTDHAEASVMFVAGGGVKGGVYNCDRTTWKDGDLFSTEERYLARKTDFRAVFGEIFTRHFGDDRALLDRIIPGYSEAEKRHAETFGFLDFMA